MNNNGKNKIEIAKIVMDMKVMNILDYTIITLKCYNMIGYEVVT